jgi:hypothetical protein
MSGYNDGLVYSSPFAEAGTEASFVLSRGATVAILLPHAASRWPLRRQSPAMSRAFRRVT